MQTTIRPWIEATFAGQEQKVFLELGAHRGEDTAWLATIPGVTVHAVEPDPRNVAAFRADRMANVMLHAIAIAAHDGVTPFTQSSTCKGCSHTKSGSIRKPTGHLSIWPEVSFGDTIVVPCLRLDSFTGGAGIDEIDFIWADTQGAEVDMIKGGAETLARTRYLYTEYCPFDPPWYDGQISLREIMALLPGWRKIQEWPYDVLLENTRRV